MKIDILPDETWEALNSSAKILLNPSEENLLKCYVGAAAAAFEIVLSTAQFYSHKRSIALIPGKTPFFQGVLPYFYKEGYEVQAAPENLNVQEWADSLKKDTCLVMIPEDHPITGQIFAIEELEKILNDKKIFCVMLSHHKHLFNAQNPLPYSVRIQVYGPQSAIAVCGSKFKSPNLLSQYIYWDERAFMDQVKSVISEAKENQALVESFETHLPGGFLPFFKDKNIRRSYDRVVIYSEKLGGESVQQFLASKLGLDIKSPGFESQVETTHLCRWGGTHANYDWWGNRPKDDILRGLLILNTEILKNNSLLEFLATADQECSISEFD